jgi:hypothetical protein
MRTLGRFLMLVLAATALGAASDTFQLPAFPVPTLAVEGGQTAEMSSIRLLRELHRAGLSGFDRLETADAEFALLRSDSLERLTTWLDATCGALDYDLRQARVRSYDGTVFARLLDVAASLGALQGKHRSLAIPIGTVACLRAKAWGQLPADNAKDIYVVFATEKGMIVYDPPTGQHSALVDFPNKATISRIRF